MGAAALLADPILRAELLGAHLRGPVVRGACGCDAAVLVVRLPNAREVVLDAEEVMPPGPCPLCKQIEQRGHDRGWCWRCGGTGVIGHALPQPAIRVDADGRAYIFKGRRQRGDAVYRLHLCDVRGGG